MIPPIHAVIVGIDKYPPPFSQLTSAVSDASKIAGFLKEHFGTKEANITLLTDVDATKDRITESISSLTGKANRNDAIIFFFSGYAGKTEQEGPEGSESTEVGIICPVDVFENGGISDKSLLQAFDQVSKSCGNNIVSSLRIRRFIMWSNFSTFRLCFWIARPRFSVGITPRPVLLWHRMTPVKLKKVARSHER
jgi:hypothetical protein